MGNLTNFLNKQEIRNPGIKRRIKRVELVTLLKKKRKDMQLTQSQLGDMLGLKQEAIARFESGKHNFTIDMLLKICEKLNVDLTLQHTTSIKKFLIFLDFDGVINSEFSCEQSVRNNEPEIMRYAPSGSAIYFLNQLIKETGAKVVISATMRKTTSLFGLHMILAQAGFVGDVIGVTPVLDRQPRGYEIQAYLDTHPDYDNFVILDDDSDFPGLENHLVSVDSEYGFDIKDLVEAERILKSVAKDV